MTESTEYPLISAIMLAGRAPTRDILLGIECFKNQTYPHKELIIINNAKNQFEAGELDISTERDIFLLDTPTNLNAGMARNYGIKSANGRILAQFDADYWHSPQRLEAQVTSLAKNEAHVSVLTKTLSYSYVSGNSSININNKNMILGTMVFIKSPNIDYPLVIKNEELGILNKMSDAGMKLISIDNPELCCKLALTNYKYSNNINNNGLNQNHFKLVKRVIKDRSQYYQ